MTAIAIVAALALGQAAPAKTISFDDAIREALARNNDLKATQARLDQARTIGWKVWSAQLPQITAGASFTHNSAAAEIALPIQFEVVNIEPNPANPPHYVTGQPIQTVNATIQKRDQLGGQVQATLPLFAPQLWFGIGAAQAGQEQAELTLESVRREILFGVAQLYYGAVGGRYAVQITDKQLAIARDHEKDAKVRFQAGTTPKVALLRAEIDRARAEQDRKAAQAGYDSARVALATMLDRPDADFEVEVPAEPSLPAKGEDLEAAALKERPEVRAAEAGLRSAERARSSALSGYLPSVGAFGRYQWANVGGFSGTETTWAVGLALTWNVFDGTLREAQIRESGAKVAEAEASRRSAELKAREDVARGRLDLEAAVANRDKAQEQVELARENQKLIEVSYKAGAATYIEVSDANNQLVTAELAVVTEQLKSRLAALRLLKAAGRFDPR